MISLRMPSASTSSCSSGRKRSSTLISGLLDVDGALGAVGRRQPGRALLIRGHQAVAEDLPVPLLRSEERRVGKGGGSRDSRKHERKKVGRGRRGEGCRH